MLDEAAEASKKEEALRAELRKTKEASPSSDCPD